MVGVIMDPKPCYDAHVGVLIDLMIRGNARKGGVAAVRLSPGAAHDTLGASNI